jgi:hypothetical protein
MPPTGDGRLKGRTATQFIQKSAVNQVLAYSSIEIACCQCGMGKAFDLSEENAETVAIFGTDGFNINEDNTILCCKMLRSLINCPPLLLQRADNL